MVYNEYFMGKIAAHSTNAAGIFQLNITYFYPFQDKNRERDKKDNVIVQFGVSELLCLLKKK